jgi:hypothetical protein
VIFEIVFLPLTYEILVGNETLASIISY